MNDLTSKLFNRRENIVFSLESPEDKKKRLAKKAEEELFKLLTGK